MGSLCYFLFSSFNFQLIKVDIGFLNRFEDKIQGELLRICASQGMLDGTLLATDDVTGRWDVLAPEYVADAVGQIADYPTVSVAWAAYLGLAVAHGWDTNWEVCLRTSYKGYYGEQGFDDMDEHIVQHVLGLSLDSKEALALEAVIRSCAQAAVTLIRREQIGLGQDRLRWAHPQPSAQQPRDGRSLQPHGGRGRRASYHGGYSRAGTPHGHLPNIPQLGECRGHARSGAAGMERG